LLLRCPNLIEGQGGLAFESEGYVLFELRVNAALEVLRFNAEGPAGLIDRKAPGKVAKLNDNQRRGSSGGRFRRLTEWCAGGFASLSNGSSKTSVSPWMRRRSAES